MSRIMPKSPPFLARLISGTTRTTEDDGLRSGALFRRRPPFGPVEYAEIIDTAVDPVGIRHVRFRLVFGYRDKAVEAGERTLAEAAFSTRFAERIARSAAPADPAETGPQG